MNVATIKAKLSEKNLGAYSLLVVTLLLCAFLTVVKGASGEAKDFLTFGNFHTFLYGVSMEFFAIIGFTFLMIMGEIDLSVGSVYAFSGLFVGYLMAYPLGLPLVLALPVSLLACALIGLVNGFLVVRYRLNSLMTTIGTMIFMRGIAQLLAEAQQGATFSRSYRSLASMRVGPIFVTVVMMIAVVAALEFLLRKHPAFRKIYYVGQNLKSATVYGIGAAKIKVVMFVVTSVTAGIGGVFASSRVMAANVTTGDKLEFKIVTAAILGGASLYGGKGGILGSALALFFLRVVKDGIVRFGGQIEEELLVIGVILIAAVFVDTLMNKEKVTY